MMKKIKILLIACLFPTVLVSCSQGLQWRESVNSEPDYNFSRRIAELKKVASGKEDNKTRARAHREMALLYYQSASPELNYAKALKELESYISLEPEKSELPEIRDMLGALRELERRRVKIAELTRSINMLQSLDVELEKQRELMK